MARNRRRSLPLIVLAATSLLLPGCKPEIPSAGALLPANGLVETAVIDEVAAASPEEKSPPADALSWEQVPAIVPVPDTEALPPPPSTPLIADPGLIPVDADSSRGQAGVSQPAGNQSVPAQSRERVLFRLSAGIAVPQSLPVGTVMAMSVDFQLAGALDQSSRYAWVVTSQGEGNVEQIIQPQVKGTLQAFFLNLRPEHRPFNCHIEEISPGGRRTRVSNVATMQTNY